MGAVTKKIQDGELTGMTIVKSYLKLMRIYHYIKNCLIFAALACSGQLFQQGKLLSGLAGFSAFCLVSSAVYIINDIRDREKDLHHPTKCNRPIASGAISVTRARLLTIFLLLAAAGCNAIVFHPASSLLLMLYLVLNIGYSCGMKNIPLVDVAILTSGFLIRILYGAVVTKISISNWLYLTVITFALYLSLGKRRNELQRIGGGETRKVLRFYNPEFLNRNMYMCLGLANAFYALWCMDDRTMQHYGSSSLILTIPVVLFITMRYSMDIEGNSDGDPVEVLIHDKSLLILCASYLIAMFLILYGVNRNQP